MCFATSTLATGNQLERKMTLKSLSAFSRPITSLYRWDLSGIRSYYTGIASAQVPP